MLATFLLATMSYFQIGSLKDFTTALESVYIVYVGATFKSAAHLKHPEEAAISGTKVI